MVTKGTYTTGRPCRHGHGTTRYLSNKDCVTCHHSRLKLRLGTPVGKRGSTRSTVRSLYGVEWDTLLLNSAGRCDACGEDFGPDGRNSPDVDHDHITGVVRGLLHHSCNTAEGYLTVRRARALADYMERYADTK